MSHFALEWLLRLMGGEGASSLEVHNMTNVLL